MKFAHFATLRIVTAIALGIYFLMGASLAFADDVRLDATYVYKDTPDGYVLTENGKAISDPAPYASLVHSATARLDPGMVKIYTAFVPGDPCEVSHVVYFQGNDKKVGITEVLTCDSAFHGFHYDDKLGELFLIVNGERFAVE